jgi:hypothetical protein
MPLRAASLGVVSLPDPSCESFYGSANPSAERWHEAPERFELSSEVLEALLERVTHGVE